MTEPPAVTVPPHPPAEGFVRMIHPSNGSVADVAESARAHHFAGGWVLLTDENAPEPESPAGEPAPMTAAQVAAGLAKETESAGRKTGRAKE